jgi:hypothetical protein
MWCVGEMCWVLVWGDLKETVCWCDLGKDKRFILQWILRKKDGSAWASTSGRGCGQVVSFCDHGNGCLVRGIAQLSEDRLASQDGLFHVQLVVKGSQFNDLNHEFKNSIAPTWKFFYKIPVERLYTIFGVKLGWNSWTLPHQKCGSQRDKISPFMIYISTLWFQRAGPVSVWSYFSCRKVMFKYDSRSCLCYQSLFGYCSIERKTWVKIRVEIWVGITESRRSIYESVKISAEENVGYITKRYEVNCDVMEAQIMCVWQ